MIILFWCVCGGGGNVSPFKCAGFSRVTDRLKWRYYIISLMSKMNTGKTAGKIIVYGVLLVFVLPVAVLVVYRKTVSFKICLYAKEYLVI